MYQSMYLDFCQRGMKIDKPSHILAVVRWRYLVLLYHTKYRLMMVEASKMTSADARANSQDYARLSFLMSSLSSGDQIQVIPLRSMSLQTP